MGVEEINAKLKILRLFTKIATKQAKQILTDTSELDPALPAVRRRLIEVMQLLPYSDPAWEAAQRLGYPKPD